MSAPKAKCVSDSGELKAPQVAYRVFERHVLFKQRRRHAPRAEFQLGNIDALDVLATRRDGDVRCAKQSLPIRYSIAPIAPR